MAPDIALAGVVVSRSGAVQQEPFVGFVSLESTSVVVMAADIDRLNKAIAS